MTITARAELDADNDEVVDMGQVLTDRLSGVLTSVALANDEIACGTQCYLGCNVPREGKVALCPAGLNLHGVPKTVSHMH